MSFLKAIKSFFTNIVVRNLLLLAAVIAILYGGILYWLEDYTRHNQAIVVPEVYKMQVEEAIPLLKAQGLRYQVVDSVNSRDNEPGAIVDQVPKGLSKVKQNRIIFLTINARNSQTVQLPNVLELSQRQALATLRAQGFKVDSIEYVPYEYRDLVLDVLYRQKTVEAQTRLPYGSSLWLQVGDGFELDQDSLHASQDSIVALDGLAEIEYEGNEWFE